MILAMELKLSMAEMPSLVWLTTKILERIQELELTPFTTLKSTTIMLKLELFQMSLVMELKLSMAEMPLPVWPITKTLVKIQELELMPFTTLKDIIMLKLEPFLMSHTPQLVETLVSTVLIQLQEWLEMKTLAKISESDLTMFISLDSKEEIKLNTISTTTITITFNIELFQIPL
jgi:hypothetical protein